MRSPIDEDKKSPMQSFKDLRLELIKTAGNNPMTPLDVKTWISIWYFLGMFGLRIVEYYCVFFFWLFRNVETTNEQGFKRNYLWKLACLRTIKSLRRRRTTMISNSLSLVYEITSCSTISKIINWRLSWMRCSIVSSMKTTSLFMKTTMLRRSSF